MRPESGDRRLRLELTAEPVSVPAARRFVTDGLSSWGLAELIDDAALCVSELAGNAALHSGASNMAVMLHRQVRAVTVSVEDDGVVPAEAVVPRPSFPGPDAPVEVLVEDESTTGRGLAIVSILATAWGVERTELGKRVWCAVNGSAEEHDVRPPETHDDLGQASQGDPSLPENWVRVRLTQCPVQLSLRQDQHLDELIRELQLISGGDAGSETYAIAAELQGLLGGAAHARHMGRRIAQQAAAEGREATDVDMAMPREFSVEIGKLEVAVQRADILCEEMRLLTLASSADVRLLRRWMTEEIEQQARHNASPVPWPDWRRTRDTIATR